MKEIKALEEMRRHFDNCTNERCYDFEVVCITKVGVMKLLDEIEQEVDDGFMKLQRRAKRLEGRISDLERDLRECDENRAEFLDQRNYMQNRVGQLEGELEKSRKAMDALGKKYRDKEASRDHWQRVASKHAAEIQRLKHELQQARKYGEIWPEFEGGGKVRIGDSMMYDEKAERVQGIRFYDTAVVFEFTGVDHCRTTYGFAHGQPVDRPPLKAYDGEPIEVGQQLMGGNGDWWTVTALHHGEKYPVEGKHAGMTKQLKPEWLTHEKLDSARRIISDHTRDVCDKIESLGVTIPEEFAIANRSYIERIEKLMKGDGDGR